METHLEFTSFVFYTTFLGHTGLMSPSIDEGPVPSQYIQVQEALNMGLEELVSRHARIPVSELLYPVGEDY